MPKEMSMLTEYWESYGRGENIESGSIWAAFWEEELVT